MSSKDEKKAILDRLLKKYNSRSAKNIDTNRRIIVKPAEIYKNYPQNNAEIAKKQCLNEAASSLLELGFVAVDYLKFSEDIEKIYLCEEKLDAIYEYLKKEYQVVPQSAVSRQIQETVKKYRVAGGPMVQRYCEEVLRQAEDPRLTMVPERIAANLKMIDFLEQNQENLYAREASMLVYGDSKWFEDNNREEVCTFLRGATETPREDSEKNDAILGLFYIAPAEQEIFIKGSWNIAWEQYSLETSKLQGGLAITSGDLQRIQRITVTSPAVLTVENKASYQRIQPTDCAMMYLGGFAGRHQIQFLRKVIHDNPDVKYQHFGDIDVGGFLIHRHLCRETGQDFALYCMGIEQLKDARFQNCLKALTDSDRSRLETLTRDASYSGVLNYMKKHNVKLEQEIVSYYLEKDRRERSACREVGMSSYERHYEALKYAMETIAESPVAGYVKELYLYGSFSRGDYKWNSDVDLLLTLDEQVEKKCRREIHMLKSQVTRDVPGAVEVDLKIVFGDDWKENNMTYYQNIRKEGKKLW